MEKFRSGITISITAVLPVFSAYIYSYFTSKGISGAISLLILSLLSAIVACISYFYIPKLLFSRHMIRLIFDPLARYEGQWIHIINVDGEIENRVCGVFRFVYDRFENCYLYTGENYDTKGNIVAFLSSRYIQYVREINGFRYCSTIRKYDESTINGWAEISFVETGEKNIDSAHGFFINSGKTLVRARFIAERITIQGNQEKLIHYEQRAKFALKYYNEHKTSLSNIEKTNN